MTCVKSLTLTYVCFNAPAIDRRTNRKTQTDQLYRIKNRSFFRTLRFLGVYLPTSNSSIWLSHGAAVEGLYVRPVTIIGLYRTYRYHCCVFTSRFIIPLIFQDYEFSGKHHQLPSITTSHWIDLPVALN